MRRSIPFVGAILLSTAWGFLDGFYVAPYPWAFCLASLSGLACLLLAPADPCSQRGGATLDGISDALILSALLISVQPVLPVLMAHLHRVPGAADAVAPLMSAIGLSAGVDLAGNLVVDTGPGARALSITWELLGLPALLRLLLAALVLGGVSRATSNAARLLLYGATRAFALLALVAGGARLSLCYEPAVTMLGFLPLAFIWTTTAGDAPASSPRPDGRHGQRAVLAGASLALAGLCFGAHMGYQDPGRLKQGRVLIDESRSDWEWTDLPFDHERYGQRSVYNYSLWRSWIDLHYATRVSRRPPTTSDLRDADVLIIKTPTAPYDQGTIERIERFVREGGGLYLISDHTNLFGMSTVLNGIAAPYGVSFEHDDTFPLDHEAYDIFRPGVPASRPVLRGIDAYPFETTCTLSVPWNADHLIVGRRLGAEPVDYGQVNFFGNIRLDPSETFGLFTQAAAVRHGGGRVVAFADSTNFSNFSMLWPGRRELTLNVVDWLNRRNDPGDSAPGVVLLIAGLAAAASGVPLLARCGKPARAAALWMLVGACVLEAHRSSSVTAAAFGAVPSRHPFHTVAFDTSLTSFKLEEASPILNQGGDLSWEGYNTFFINTARSGVWPEVTTALVPALRWHDTVVLANPVRPPSSAEMDAFGGFLKRGGRLLILDSVFNARSTASLITAPFGLVTGLTLQPLDAPAGRPVAPVLSATLSKGANRRVTHGGVVAVWRDVGAGRLVIATDAALFSDRGFGGVYTMPRGGEREIYEGQKDLFRILLEPQLEEPSR